MSTWAILKARMAINERHYGVHYGVHQEPLGTRQVENLKMRFSNRLFAIRSRLKRIGGRRPYSYSLLEYR